MIASRLARFLIVVLATLGAIAAAPSAVLAGNDMDLPIAPSPDPLAVDVEVELDVPDHDTDVEIPVEDDPTVVLYDESVPVAGESIVFVIDTSGSMSEAVAPFTGLDGRPTYGTRLDRAKVELIRAISALGESFHFTVHAYSCVYYNWNPSRRRATAENKASAIRWVQALYPLGGTGTGQAVAIALQDRENTTIALLTDGAPGCGGHGETIDSHLQMIVSANRQQAAVHCFGIGAYGAFEQFLRNVSVATGGTYHPVN